MSVCEGGKEGDRGREGAGAGEGEGGQLGSHLFAAGSQIRVDQPPSGGAPGTSGIRPSSSPPVSLPSAELVAEAEAEAVVESSHCGRTIPMPVASFASKAKRKPPERTSGRSVMVKTLLKLRRRRRTRGMRE
jgi:hypothetical protein